MGERIYTTAEKLAELERELAVRRRAYPRFVSRASITQAQADERMAVLSAIAEDYRALAQKERLL